MMARAYNEVAYNGVAYNEVAYSGVAYNEVAYNEVAYNGVAFEGVVVVTSLSSLYRRSSPHRHCCPPSPHCYPPHRPRCSPSPFCSFPTRSSKVPFIPRCHKSMFEHLDCIPTLCLVHPIPGLLRCGAKYEWQVQARYALLPLTACHVLLP